MCKEKKNYIIKTAALKIAWKEVWVKNKKEL